MEKCDRMFYNGSGVKAHFIFENEKKGMGWYEISNTI